MSASAKKFGLAVPTVVGGVTVVFVEAAVVAAVLVLTGVAGAAGAAEVAEVVELSGFTACSSEAFGSASFLVS